jgi:hypothetical protein
VATPVKWRPPRIVITPTALPATSAPAALPGLAAISRPDPPGAWAASVAFGWRALLKIRQVPEMLLDVIAIPGGVHADVHLPARRRAGRLLAHFGQQRLRRPHTMPGWLQASVRVSPVTHLVTAERAMMVGQPAASQLAWVVLGSAALAAVFDSLTAWLYGRQR